MTPLDKYTAMSAIGNTYFKPAMLILTLYLAIMLIRTTNPYDPTKIKL